ncbi:inositol polyphosphate-5-phosphatase A isoform X2 [Bactrocera neohumeralis]|uniref:inositol polyphosphate-5-phosphatase A isoform X2 n=1 Tax=Bactrocera neohumeralis TaxID=98809 RepID=UPI002165F867|nr:inositol polyphosphate-5-phosphatase A isoform X2 [Bactrocera neohumeralis]XP_050337785.1 inositol polyphosphate-5-phosphatase A isoform X2 [Bactrocera neohumeralis]
MDNSNLLLVTANVGTLFEDPKIFTSSLRSILLLYVDEGYHLVLFGMWLFDTSFQGFTFYESGVGEFSIRTGEKPLILMQQWIHEFMLTVKQLHPQFIALHLQEVGGKTYEQSSHYVKEFVKSLCEAYEMQEFSIVRIYLDENFNSQEQFTALGNLYFGHNTIPNSRLWNFKNCSWETTQGKNFYFGNIENVPTKDKSKFPLDFFPECKWSRKGFMRTRWNINGTILDFVNMHLFHDASNLTALIEFPSVYSQRRRKALIHTLQRFDMDKDNEIVPYFLFGDFNFRSDSAGVIKIFNIEQEKALISYILQASDINYGISLMELRKLTYEFARKVGASYPDPWNDNQLASKDWQLAFMKRHKNLSLRTPEQVSQSRAKRFNKENVDAFFANLSSVLGKTPRKRSPSPTETDIEEDFDFCTICKKKTPKHENRQNTAHCIVCDRGVHLKCAGPNPNTYTCIHCESE